MNTVDAYEILFTIH